ncbi:MAG TPA: hypothetical protein DEA55_10285 [Rhodospirillaceae bacterium]|nr:hypothetical protein [Rhodospirillaceae bacterium]
MIRSKKFQSRRGAEKGSALVYILIAIALLAALTFTFMEPSSQQTSSQNTFKTITGLQGQVDVIRSAIQECVLNYPKGDVCIKNDASAVPGYCTSAAVTDPGARKNYPINPDSDHYTNATPGKSGDRLVRNIRCPGSNGGNNANHDNHEMVFSGASGKFMPPAPDLFENWKYFNGADGIFFWTETTKSDAFLVTALNKLDEEYSECEADVIDATGGVENLDSVPTAGVTCPNGSVCFRVWMISNAATRVLVNVDAGCD